jgi:hypothetical protein
MKTKIMIFACFTLLFSSTLLAQDRTTVNATNSEISDNLDLRAIASIFGDAKNLEDFERQLNDPKIQISNLDLNDDNQVDYLRVIESVEENTHLIIVQAVLGRDTFQDVATIEVEKDRNNQVQVQVQVVGDVYMYGQNYIYEPVYISAPIIYTTFWTPRYRPYCSAWYWNYYPTYYYAWNPYPVFRYRNNVSIHINFNHHYSYVNTRRCARAVVMHQPFRANYCERTHPKRAFAYRNNSVKNRYELDRTRTIKNVGTQNDVAYTNTRNNGRYNDPIKQSTKNETNAGTRTNNGATNRDNTGQKPRTENATRYEQTNSGTKSPVNYNQGRSFEKVASTGGSGEIRSNNARQNNYSRRESASNERGYRK